MKSAQKLENGALEDNHSSIDKNLYVDCILDVVLAKGGNRRIVFSCFDADICVMLRNKQNMYPVMFLTLGQTARYPQYHDPRCNKIENAVKFASANELLGIVAHTEDLLRDISQVNLAKDMGLVIFCWGDDNNNKDTIKYLKEAGLHAIIYDKVDVLKDLKVNSFIKSNSLIPNFWAFLLLVSFLDYFLLNPFLHSTQLIYITHTNSFNDATIHTFELSFQLRLCFRC